MTILDLNTLIKSRRSIFPPSYNETPIADDIINQVLENANYAPTHKLTEPWRFKILRGVALQRLAAFLVEDYKSNTPQAQQNEIKLKKIAENPLRSGCVILICMQRQPDMLPEWEEIAAVSMAVQNMWLTCTAHQIGCYWSSPAAIQRMVISWIWQRMSLVWAYFIWVILIVIHHFRHLQNARLLKKNVFG